MDPHASERDMEVIANLSRPIRGSEPSLEEQYSDLFGDGQSLADDHSSLEQPLPVRYQPSLGTAGAEELPIVNSEDSASA